MDSDVCAGYRLSRGQLQCGVMPVRRGAWCEQGVGRHPLCWLLCRQRCQGIMLLLMA